MARIDIKTSSTGGGGGGGNLQLSGGASMSGTLTAVADTANTASPLKLSTTGVQSTSKIQITTADTNYIDAEDNSGNNRFTVGRGVGSQLVTVDFASVPTDLTTPVGAIRTATDGVNLVNVQTFLENGNIGLGTDTPGSKLDVHSTGAIVAQFNKTVSGNSYIQQLMAGTARWKYGFTTATGAFDIIDDVNALTRLSLLNTGQLKLNAYTSTSAFTGTTAGFLAFDASGNILSVTSPATSPAGTTGAVQFNNAGAFGADSTNFFWDNTNKRLGVGTATPTTLLTLFNSSYPEFTINDGTIRAQMFANTGSGSFVIGTGTSHDLILRTANTSRLRILSTGNIGIGTDTPTSTLQVKGSGSTSATTSLLVQNSAGTAALTVTDDLNVTIGNRLFLGSNSDQIYPQSGLPIAIRGFHGAQVIRVTGSTQTMFEVSDLGVTTAGLLLNVKNNSFANMFAVNYLGQASMATASPNASAQMQIDSTSRGFLPPRMTTAQKNAIGTPAAGLMVYDTTLNKLCVYTTAWETITSI
jgi:hypothetical protein